MGRGIIAVLLTLSALCHAQPAEYPNRLLRDEIALFTQTARAATIRAESPY